MRFAIGLLVLVAMGGATEAAHASTPASIQLAAPLSNDEPIITWNSVPGTDQYRLTGTTYVLRVNARNAFCTPPVSEDEQTLTLDETLGGSATRFELPLAELPAEDAWFFSDTNVTLEAFDSEGVLLAAGNVGGIAETNPLHCATVQPVLPTTGGGGASVGGHHTIVYFLATVIAAGALSALAPRRALRG